MNSKPLSRTNLILLAVLALQLVVMVVVFWPRPTVTAGSGKALLEGLSADKITRITIQDNEGNTIALAKEGDQWVLPDSDNYPATQDRATALLDKLVALKADRKVTETESSQKQLQVAATDFMRRIELEADGAKWVLYLGSSPSYTTVHARVDGQTDVYLAGGLSTSDAGAAITSWVDTKFAVVPPEQLVGLTISNAQGTFELSKDSAGLWALKGLPTGETIDKDKVDTLVNGLATLYMMRPLGKEERAEYGLSTPGAVITLQQKDAEGKESVHTLKVGAYNEMDKSYIVSASDSEYFAQVAEYEVQGAVEWGQADFLVQPTPAATPQQ